MSRIERDVKGLMPAQHSWSLLDGLLLGAVIGAAGATLVIVGQIVATRRLARRYGGASRPPLPGGPAGISSPL
jgi:hypothetical protein